MAPAGSFESLHAAIDAGADSVYFGIGELNMRARSAANFTVDDLEQVVSICRAAGVKSYLTVNTILYDHEMERMREIIGASKATGVDAVIVSDQSAILYAASIGQSVHISTQLNVSNVETLRFYARWADVVVLARELDLDSISYIYQAIERENICGPSGRRARIEMFAHGALCMSISGKCYLSLHMDNCSANRGACRQICRRSYELRDTLTGESIAVDGQYLLSPKDLCTIGFLDRFIEAGVRVLKIEGRARSSEYVKRVVECYDGALRAIEEGRYTPEFVDSTTARLAEVFNRGFWGGYYLPTEHVSLSGVYGSAATKRKVYVGKVTNVFKRISVAEIKVEGSSLDSNDNVVITGATTGALEFVAEQICLDDRTLVDHVSQGAICSLKIPSEVHRGDKLYKIVDAQ